MHRILQLYLYKIPEALQLFFPVACLMATLLVLSNMSRQNEVLALYSGGIGNFRLVSTFLAVVAVLCTGFFLVFDTLNPLFARKQWMIKNGLDPDADVFKNFGQSRLWYRSGNIIYNVGQFQSQQQMLTDVNVYLLGQDFRVYQKIHAKKASYVDNDWTLTDGMVTTYPSDQFPVASLFESKKALIQEKPKDFQTLQLEESTMRLKQLRKYIDRNKAYGFDTTAQQVNYYERMALVFTPLIFVLLAFPFATRPMKMQSMAKSVSFCFVTVFIYLVMFRFFLPLGKGGKIPPMIAGWTSNVVFLAYALYGLRKRVA